MKKGVVLLSLFLAVTVIPPAFAGKNNTVNDYWYYNDPNKAYAPNHSGSSYTVTYPAYYPSYYPAYYPCYTPSYTPVRNSYPSANYGSLGYRTLKRTYPCMRGSDVRALQNMLNALGYRCGRADGIFGDRTKAAVKAFQRHNGLVVDGIVGRATKSRLLARYRRGR